MPTKHTSTNTKLLTISKIISHFFNPLTSLVLYFFYFSYSHYTWKQSLQIFLPILLILILPISVWIIWNVKKGNYSNVDVSNRNQRKSLYFMIALALLVFLGIDYLINEKMNLTILFVFVLLLLMQISNYFIKSSMHTAFNVFVAALFFAENEILGGIWLLIAILVGVTRIILKRHTSKEVLMGASIALLVSFVYLYAMINLGIQH